MDTTPDDRLLVPINDTRRLLGGLSRTTVYELIDRGELAKVKIGARAFVTGKSIAAYVDRLTQAAHV
jgi:predicted DNA-binding transcriptional regulator AlpA